MLPRPSFATFVDGKSAPCVKCTVFALNDSKLLKRTYSRSGTNPFALFALLLLTVPEVFTLRGLFAIPVFGERSHQLRAEQPLPNNLITLDFCIFPGLIYAIHELSFALQLSALSNDQSYHHRH